MHEIRIFPQVFRIDAMLQHITLAPFARRFDAKVIVVHASTIQYSAFGAKVGFLQGDDAAARQVEQKKLELNELITEEPPELDMTAKVEKRSCVQSRTTARLHSATRI